MRRARVEYQGAIYHVIQRGNNRENVFESPENKNTEGRFQIKKLAGGRKPLDEIACHIGVSSVACLNTLTSREQ